MARQPKIPRIIGSTDRTKVAETSTTQTFIFMFQVQSSNVAFVGLGTGNKMYVQYKNEAMYVFDEIGRDQFLSILKAESVGKAILATGIKGVKI